MKLIVFMTHSYRSREDVQDIRKTDYINELLKKIKKKKQKRSVVISGDFFEGNLLHFF